MNNYKYTKPLLMPRSTHYGNNYWIFYSNKIKRVVTAFSTLEYENLIILEMDYLVKYFCEQPTEVTVRINNEIVKSIFDVYVVHYDNTESMIEVKYQEEIDEPVKGTRSRRQINAQKEWCRNNNVVHILRTDKDIHLGNCYISNLEYLANKVRRYDEFDDKKQIGLLIAHLERYRILTISNIIDLNILATGREMDILAFLYYHGVIKFVNIENKPINGDMEVIINAKS